MPVRAHTEADFEMSLELCHFTETPAATPAESYFKPACFKTLHYILKLKDTLSSFEFGFLLPPHSYYLLLSSLLPLGYLQQHHFRKSEKADVRIR